MTSWTETEAHEAVKVLMVTMMVVLVLMMIDHK